MAFLKNFRSANVSSSSSAEFFNIYNHLNMGDPATALTSVTSAQSVARMTREISQLALKFFFERERCWCQKTRNILIDARVNHCEGMRTVRICENFGSPVPSRLRGVH